MKRRLLLACLVGFSSPALARDLRIATWNLGWHLSQAEAQTWITRCGAPFARNAATGQWEPASSGTPGWELRWGRDANILWDLSVLPPCDVFQANFRAVPATSEAYARRSGQIASLLSRTISPDVIAFQEVSGEHAVREVLPDGGAKYHVCSFAGYKVQRLAFAWRKELGEAAEPCAVHDPLSLPSLAAESRVRPGLSLGLRINGKLVRFLSVHLKSSCVSPLEAGASEDGRGALAGDNPACQVLQQQVQPLEAWIEEKAEGADALVVLGDFNRNLWHEQTRPSDEPVRTDGSEPASPLPDGVKVRYLLPEVDDSEPEATSLTLLDEVCVTTSAVARLCEKAKTALLSRQEAQQVSAAEGLGCRNPIGLDHILISESLTALPAQKVALGVFGRTRPATNTRPAPLLTVSDHYPLATTVRF